MKQWLSEMREVAMCTGGDGRTKQSLLGNVFRVDSPQGIVFCVLLGGRVFTVINCI